jgi:hypothetical protein
MDPSQEKQIRTGSRKKRPTERFKSYIESTAGTRTRRRHNNEDSSSSGENDVLAHAAGHKEVVVCGTTSYESSFRNTDTLYEHQSVDNSSTKRKKRAKKNRTYICNHCAFEDSTCPSAGQAFIKAHHTLPQNKDCYLYGLIHCPNPKCTKVCLTEKDMEMHCSMTKNSSKNPCLQAFSLLKAIEKEQVRQNSTQIDLPLPTHNQQATTAQLSRTNGFWHLNQYLPAESNEHQSSSSLNHSIQADSNNTFHTCHQGQFNSDIHYYNILHQHDEGWVKESSTIKQYSGHGGNTQVDAEFLFHGDDIEIQSSTSSVERINEISIEIGNNDIANTFAVDTLNELRLIIETSSRDMCLPKEYTACFALEQILRDAGSPVYLYEKVMKWASLYKYSLPSVVSTPGRTELLNISAQKVYGKATEKMKPKEEPTQLPSGRRCGVTTFNIYAQIVSLLSDTNINSWSDYIFKETEEDPFHLNIFQNWEEGYFNDIEAVFGMSGHRGI